MCANPFLISRELWTINTKSETFTVRGVRPLDPENTTYQTINYEKKFALATTMYSNGTRVESTMPFETCGRGDTIYFADDTSVESNITRNAQSFELVYASTSLRVDRMVANGAYRVFVPCNDFFVS